MKFYREAETQPATPPPPKVLVEPAKPPNPVLADQVTQSCPNVASMTHEQKMEEAIKRAPLTDAVRAELGDLKVLVATMIIVAGTLALIAATGYGAIAEGIGAGLLLLGGALSGYEIGTGITRLVEFFQETRCDRASTLEDLDKAGNSFADAIAKMGIGGLNLVLGMRGAKGRNWRGQKLAPPRSLGPANEFFKNTRYTGKVKSQMGKDDFHGFPEEVTNHADKGTVKTIVGGDGVERQMLEIPGEYKGKTGTFEFIKEPDGSINHRYFRPN